MTGAADAAALVALASTGAGGLRWLRVAQREHYLPGSTTRFALRWWGTGPANAGLAALGAAGAVAAFLSSLCALATAAVVAIGPLGLGLRGRTSKLAWTRRLRTLAAVWAVLQLAAVGGAWAAGIAPGVSAVAAIAAPLVVDLSLALTRPAERVASQRFVGSARDKLSRVRPRVVAITGSYGKTSTKFYVAHLLEGSFSVLASPASYNNTPGLARTVNENLALGTEVFVAEMGTYARGEIADMCAWVVPDIAVITAIGPVHLERFGTEEEILVAKAEITERAPVVVLNVDYPLLDSLSSSLRGKQVVRCSSKDPSADVCVLREGTELTVMKSGEVVARTAGAPGAELPAPGNVACAVSVALSLGVAHADLGRRLGDLPAVPNRLSVYSSGSGFTVLDDTYNSNPAGARSALEALRRRSTDGGRMVVVTPGMVELGRRQREENAAFGAAAAGVATDVVVVGRTNKKALLEGLACGRAKSVVTVRTREQAVDWVRSQLGRGDVVLYENDLPDHFA